MKTLTKKELKQTNGGFDAAAIARAVAEIQRQNEAIERLGNSTGSSADWHY